MPQNIEMPNKLSIISVWRWAIALVFFSVLTWSCHDPQPTYSKEKMQAILLDVHTAEVMALTKDTTTGDLTQIKDSTRLIQLYNSIWQHHQTSYEEFIDNYKTYLNSKISDMDEIYKNIQTKIGDYQVIKINAVKPENIEVPQDTVTSAPSEKGALRPELIDSATLQD